MIEIKEIRKCVFVHTATPPRSIYINKSNNKNASCDSSLYENLQAKGK